MTREGRFDQFERRGGPRPGSCAGSVVQVREFGPNDGTSDSDTESSSQGHPARYIDYRRAIESRQDNGTIA